MVAQRAATRRGLFYGFFFIFPLIPAGVATPRENGGEKHEQRAFRSGTWR